MTLSALRRRVSTLAKQFAKAIDAETDARIAARKTPQRPTRYTRRLAAIKAGKR